jgi:hypothetical protein
MWCYTKGGRCGNLGISNWKKCGSANVSTTAGVSLQTTTTVPVETPQLDILQPKLGEIWLLDTTVSILLQAQYVPNTNTITIELLQLTEALLWKEHSSSPFIGINTGDESFTKYLNSSDFIASERCKMYRIKAKVQYSSTVLLKESPSFYINDATAIKSVVVKTAQGVTASSFVRGKVVSIYGTVSCSVKNVEIELIRQGVVMLVVAQDVAVQNLEFQSFFVIPANVLEGSNYKFHIVDLESGVSLSSLPVTVTRPIVPKSIFVTIPVEPKPIWRIGEEVKVLWSFTGSILRVNIDIFSVDGLNIIRVAENVSSLLKKFVFNISNSTTPSGVYYVSVLDAEGNDAKGSSSLVTVMPKLTNTSDFRITSVFTASCCEQMATCTIYWDTINFPAASSFDIAYSTPGSTPTTIVSKAASKGFYSHTWSVPKSIAPGDYTIVVTSSGTNSVSDIFTVAAPQKMKLDVPSLWHYGTPTLVQWVLESGCSIHGNKTVDILLQSAVRVRTVATLASTKINVLHGSFAISNVLDQWNGEQLYQIKVVDHPVSSTSKVWLSDSFKIASQESISFVTPSQGKVWYVGDTIIVNWLSEGSIPEVNVHLYDNGNFYKDLAAHWPNGNSFSFSSETFASSRNYQIKIIGKRVETSVVSFSERFSILDLPHASIELRKPSFEDTWVTGKVHEISWVVKVPNRESNKHEGDIFTEISLCNSAGIKSLFLIAKNVRSKALPRSNSLEYAVPDFTVNVQQRQTYTICIRGIATNLGSPNVTIAVSKAFRIVRGPTIVVLDVRISRVADPIVLTWRSDGLPIPVVNVSLRQTNSSTSIRLATNIENMGFMSALAPKSVHAKIPYVFCINSSKLTANCTKEFVFEPASRSSNAPAILQPTAASIFSPSDKIITVQWTTSIENSVNVTITLNKRDIAYRQGVQSWVLRSISSGGTQIANEGNSALLLPTGLTPGFGYYINVKINYSQQPQARAVLSLVSKDFTVVRPQPSLSVDTVSGGSSLLQFAIVSGRKNIVHWSGSGQLGVVSVELWKCFSVPQCPAPKFELKIDSVNTNKYFNQSRFGVKTQWTPQWTVPPQTGAHYKVILRSQNFPLRYFAMSDFVLRAKPDICVTGSGNCESDRIRLVVKKPSMGATAVKGNITSIEWEFEVKSPTEWTSPNHVSISLWNGEALVSVISEQALNTGRFAWVVDPRLPVSGAYYIKIQSIKFPTPWSKLTECVNIPVLADSKNCISHMFEIQEIQTKETSGDYDVTTTIEVDNLQSSTGWGTVSTGNFAFDHIVSPGATMRLNWSSWGTAREKMDICLVQLNGASIAQGYAVKTVMEKGVDIAGSHQFKIPAHIDTAFGQLYSLALLGRRSAAVPTVRGITRGFYLEKAEELSMFPRGTVVRGSTFNFQWEVPKRPFVFKVLLVQHRMGGSRPKANRKLLDRRMRGIWESITGHPCTAFLWDGRVRKQCVSGPVPKLFQGNPWCATKVDEAFRPLKTELCPKVTEFPGAISAKALNTTLGYFRWKVPGDTFPPPGDGYYFELIDATSGNTITRTNEFKIGCASLEIEFKAVAALPKNEYKTKILGATKMRESQVEIKRILADNRVIMWMTTGGKMETDTSRCPVQQLSTVSHLPFVASIIQYKVLDLFSEDVPVKHIEEGKYEQRSLTFFILGIGAAIMVIILFAFSAWRLRKNMKKQKHRFGAWKAAKLRSKKKYFVNYSTGESSWRPPKIVKEKNLVIEMVNNPITKINKESSNKLLKLKSMSENLKNVQGKRKPDALVDPKLLEGWHKDKTVGGEDYYWHDDGVTTSWTLPNWYPEGWARKKEGDEMPEEADEDLLPGWNVSVTENDQIFYWHDDNVSTSWDKPDWIPEGWVMQHRYFVGQAPVTELPMGWSAVETEDENHVYYFNERTHETCWELPTRQQDLHMI